MSTLSRATWGAERPFPGGLPLIVSGLVVGNVSSQTRSGIQHGNIRFSLAIALLLILSAGVAIVRPNRAMVVGLAGMAFSILLFIGALGRWLLGPLIGFLGGVLCIVWAVTVEH